VLLRQAIVLLEENGKQGTFVWFMLTTERADTKLRMGRLVEAEQDLLSALDHQGGIDSGGRGNTYLMLGICQGRQGRFEEAAAAIVRSINLLQANGHDGRAAMAMSNLAMMAVHFGQETEAIDTATRALQLTGDDDDPDRVITRCQCRWIQAVCGQGEGVVDHLQQAIQQLLAQGNRAYASHATACLAWLCLMNDDVDAGERAYERLGAPSPTPAGLAARTYIAIRKQRFIEARGTLEPLSA
jgi:tetratricopeptide (TPR) repeat protein